ncbi:hypothetical protein MHU86_1350 [Fragilaria crotonensis]|nr:hypothetical protein MHU86_1350 [Fragilaria crotonensis]
MWCGKAILLLLVLAFTAKDVSAGCTVVDRFIGVDSGDFVGMSFKYDLTVKSGTTQADIRTNILPAIEKALAEKIAPFIIPTCAASGTDTSKYPDVVGLDLDPKDTIAGACATNVANCYTINGKMSVYVSSTAKNVASYFNFAVASVLGTLKTETFLDNAIASLGNFISVQTPSSSPTSLQPTWAIPSSTSLPSPTPLPVQKTSATTARPTFRSPTWGSRRTGLPISVLAPSVPPESSGEEKTFIQMVKDLKNDNPGLFFFAIGSIIVAIILAIIGGCYCYWKVKLKVYDAALGKGNGNQQKKPTKK